MGILFDRKLLEALATRPLKKMVMRKYVAVYLLPEEFDRLTEFCKKAKIKKSHFFRTMLNTSIKRPTTKLPEGDSNAAS